MIANMHAANSMTTIAESLIVVSRSKSTGRKGAGCLRSCQQSTLSATTAVTAMARLRVDVHANRRPPEVSQKSALTAPTAKSRWPGTSVPPGRGCRSPCGRRHSLHAANAASGKLARKSHRQLTCDTTNPPITGPPMLAVVNISAKYP